MQTPGIQADVELRHLRYFVAVAEELHFSRAARSLHMSQPSLSRQIRDLERHIGTPLLHRSMKSVALTEAGKIFLKASREILNQVSRSVRMAQQAAAGELGRLEIGVPPFFRSRFFAALRERLHALYPELVISFHRLSSEEQVPLIRNGSLDAGFLMLPVTEFDELTTEPLFRERAILLLAKSHPLAAKSELAVHEIGREPILRIKDEFAPAPYDHATRISSMCNVPLRAGLQVPSLPKLLDAVREARGLALLPACAAELSGPGIRSVPISDRSADYTFALSYRRSVPSNALSRFLEVVRPSERLEKELVA